jgi:hypothetical protein
LTHIFVLKISITTLLKDKKKSFRKIGEVIRYFIARMMPPIKLDEEPNLERKELKAEC